MATVQTEVEPQVTRAQAIGWLRQMLLIRRFEERSAMLYQNQKIGGFCHLYSGQESVAVGSIGALREDDYVITAYRDHGHALARGMDLGAAMAEMLGKAAGCSKGKGGRCTSSTSTRGSSAVMPSSAATSRSPPASPSPAKYKGEDKVCICYFGDGAMDQGSLHEAFNMASALEAAGHLRRREQHDVDGDPTPSPQLPDRPHDPRRDRLRDARNPRRRQRHRGDGAATTREAASEPAQATAPTFIEAKTYRFRGHSMSDPMKYRTKEEADKAKERDPIVLLRVAPQGARLDRRRRRSKRCTRRSRSRSTRRSSSPRTRRSRSRRRLRGHLRRGIYPAGVSDRTGMNGRCTMPNARWGIDHRVL